MKRLPVILSPLGIIVLLALASGWNRTAADDQSVDFRLSQIMIKLNQIEWELSRVKNWLEAQDGRFDEIEGQLNRIRGEIGDAGSVKPPSSPGPAASAASVPAAAATDPALAGAWRLSRNDFAEEIPENIRRYLAEQGSLEDLRNRPDRIDEDVGKTIDKFEEILDQTGFRLIRFRLDGMYTDGTGDEGQWLVSANRLILTSFDGRAHPFTYAVNGADLTLTITGDQIGTLFLLEAGRTSPRTREMIESTFKYTDRVRLFYSKDF